MFLFVISLLDYYRDGETLLDYYGKGNQSGFGGVDVQTELGGQPWSISWSMDRRSCGPIWLIWFVVRFGRGLWVFLLFFLLWLVVIWSDCHWFFFFLSPTVYVDVEVFLFFFFPLLLLWLRLIWLVASGWWQRWWVDVVVVVWVGGCDGRRCWE